MAKSLTDRAIKALPPAAPGKRKVVHDADVPGFAVRRDDDEDAAADLLADESGAVGKAVGKFFIRREK